MKMSQTPLALALALAFLAGCGSKVKPVAPETVAPPVAPPALRSWIQTYGPATIPVGALLPTGFTLLAGTPAGIYRSADIGRSWTPVLTGRPVAAFASRGTTRFAVAGDQVLRSRNDGVSWLVVSAGLPAGSTILALLATDMGTLFVGAGVNGVYRSQDDGDTWVPVNTGLPASPFARSFHQSPDGTILASIEGTLYQTADQGEQWEPAVTTGLPTSGINAFEESGSSLLVGNLDGVYVRNASIGLDWIADSDGLPSSPAVLALDAVGSARLAGTTDGLFRSVASNTPWVRVPTVLPSGLTQYLALETLGSWQFAGTSRGLLRSNNAGLEWVTAGPVGGDTRAVAELNGRVVAATAGEGLCVSFDEARTWGVSSKTFGTAYCLGGRGSTYFAGADDGDVYQSSNGVTWSDGRTNLPDGDVLSIATSATCILAGLEGESIHRSTDNVFGFVPSAGLPLGCTAPSIVAAGSRFFAAVVAPAAADNGVYVSTDDGVHWTRSSTGLPSSLPVVSVASSGAKVFAATRQGIYVSSDGGATWALSGLFSEKLVSVAAHETLVAVVNDRGEVLRSNDSGATWSRDAGVAITKSVTAGNAGFYAATNRGVFLALY